VAHDRPNILLITSDQQHYSTLGCINPHIQTPNLDRLAAQGLRFDRAYCPNPTCTPTRASIITGQYPSQHGAWSLGTKLLESEPVVGDDLRAAGYRTALVGKAHFQPLDSTEDFPSLESYPVLQDLDFWRRFDEPFYGFDTVRLARNHADEAHVGQHYALWMEEKGYTQWREAYRPPTGTNTTQRHRWVIPEEYHYDAWIAEESERLLEGYAESGDPFFLWSSFFDPHPPYLAPEPWDSMYEPGSIPVAGLTPGEHDANPPHFAMTQQEKPDFSAWRESGFGIHGMNSHRRDAAELDKDVAVYYGMVSLMDKYIGRILDRLEALGLAENTLVVFTTDHGHLYGQHGMTAKGPFHYEDLVKLPFVARWPGQIAAGSTTDHLLSLVDLAPTFLEAAGLGVPGRMSGVSQLDALRGGEAARDHVVVENHHEPTTIHVKTYVDERYKLTVYYRHDYGELFDLQADPQERRNLWDDADHAALKTELTRRLLFAEMGKEVLPMPRIAGA
jgi:arylsulfatase A-like enzyme